MLGASGVFPVVRGDEVPRLAAYFSQNQSSPRAVTIRDLAAGGSIPKGLTAMFRITKNHMTTVLTLAALLAAVFFSAGEAEAGTQMPPWKKLMMQNRNIAPPAAAPASTPDSQVQLVEEVEGPANGGEGNNGGQVGGGEGEGHFGGNGGKAPAAAPTPSAVAGGVAMLALIAGRRRRQADSDTA